MDRELYLILFLVALAMNLISYFFIRCLIWSIVWCDKGGKQNKLSKLNRQKRIADKISMAHLRDFVNSHTKQFDFWYRIKQIFVIVEFIFAVVGVIGGCLYSYLVICANIFILFYLLESFIFAWIFMLQFDTSRNSKYDRMRLARKRNK